MLGTNVSLKDVKLVLNPSLDNPLPATTVPVNVDFANFAKDVLLDKFPIVTVGALLDKTNVSAIVKVVVLNVWPVKELVLLKENPLLKHQRL